MGALTPAKYDAATVTFSTLFREVLLGTPTYYQRIATEIPSSTREMRHAWLDRIPQMREWLGERVVNNLAVRLQSIENKLFEDTVAVKRTDIEDDLIGVYRPVIEELAMQAKLWPDKIVVDALQGATSALSYDGQHFSTRTTRRTWTTRRARCSRTCSRGTTWMSTRSATPSR